MKEELMGSIVDAFVNQIIAEGKDIFKGVYEEAKQLIGKDLQKYLNKQKDKYSHIKTLLRGNSPVYLYDVYYPLFLLKENDRGGFDQIEAGKINGVFYKTNYISIFGEAGSGKSTLIKHLFLNCIKEKYGIPVLIELRYLNETNGNIEEFIEDKIFENKLSQNSEILSRLLKSGRFIFFLDGYDEVNSDIKMRVVNNLHSFVNKNSENKFLLTTRPYSGIEQLQLFTNLNIKKLDEQTGEIDGFIDLQLKGERELAEKIKASIKGDNVSDYIKSFLTNPLLLTLYILTFQSNAEIPNKKYIFYRRVINALFSEHDSKTKLGWVREKLSKLNQEQFEDMLKAFCFISYFESRFSFDYDYANELLTRVKKKIGLVFNNNDLINDLKSTIGLWVEDVGDYSFAHRSLQEYFTALFIKNLSEAEKVRVYKKIIERFENTQANVTEMDNLLSLCYEMDELNFYKAFYLPLLEEAHQSFGDLDKEDFVYNFLTFFIESITIEPNRFYKIKVTDIAYKTIYTHFKYTRTIHGTITDYVFSVSREEKMNLKKPKNIFNDVREVMKSNDDVKKMVINLNKHINSELKRVGGFIKESSLIDRDLVNMI